MVKGKRTGSIPRTIFFNELEPAPARPVAVMAVPQKTPESEELHAQRKTTARKLQMDYLDKLQQQRQLKRKQDNQRFKDYQTEQMMKLEEYIAAANAKKAQSQMDVDQSASPSNAESSSQAELKEDDGKSKPESVGFKNSVVETMGDVTDEDKILITQRLKITQLKFEALARREKEDKIDAIMEILPHLTEEEVVKALETVGGDEFDVMEEYDKFSELRELRHNIAKFHTAQAEENKKKEQQTSKQTSKAKKTGEKSAKTGTKNPANQKKKASNTSETSKKPLTTANITNAPSPSNNNQSDLSDIAVLLPKDTDLNWERPSTALLGELSDSSYQLYQNNDDASSSEDVYELDGEGYTTRTHKKKKHVTVKKLKLDDAIAQGSTEGWSTARVRAWNLRHENPNAYYYRFNHPGEIQRNGKWTEAERERFFARMTEVGVNGQWGMFAKEIYGRVGYQCANFYRQMIENNEIEDPRYVIDENGKAHFLFSKRKKTAKNNEEDDGDMDSSMPSEGMEGMTKLIVNGKEIYIPKINVPIKRTAGASSDTQASSSHEPVRKKSPATSQNTVPSTNTDKSTDSEAKRIEKEAQKAQKAAEREQKKLEDSKKVKKKPSKKRKREDYGDDAEYRPSSTWTRERVDKAAKQAFQSRLDANPLPGFKDAITNAEITEPTISPYGHVLSYSTWIKCLASEPKNTCPFTKKPVKKRDLVVLTWDNLAQYKDKIIHNES